MDSFFSLLFRCIYQTRDRKFLETILIILTVKLTFIKNPHLISRNARPYRLFHSQRAISSYLKTIGMNALNSDHVSLLISNIMEVSELETLIIFARELYCSVSNIPPFFSSVDYIISLFSPDFTAEKSFCPMNPTCQTLKCPLGFSKGGQKTLPFTLPYLNKTTSSRGSFRSCVSTRFSDYSDLSDVERPFPSSFENPLITAKPAFEKSRLDDVDIEDFMMPDIKDMVFNLLDEALQFQDQSKFKDEEKLQCTYFSDVQFFEVIFYDRQKAPNSTRGSFKHIKPDNIIFLIKKIPLWHWFLGGGGCHKTIQGWQVVSVAGSSPGFGLLGHEKFRKTLLKEGFDPVFRETKVPDKKKEVFIAPYYGENLNFYKSFVGGVDFNFLSSLNIYLLDLLITSNPFDIHDIKPSNILYHSRKKTFELIDYKEDKVSYAFCCFQAHRRPSRKDFKKAHLQVLADNIVLTTYYMFDKDCSKTKEFFSRFFLIYNEKYSTHPVYLFMCETLNFLT